MSVRVFAPAKINLTLEVGPPRADGRHPLQSAVAFADVGDWVEAAPAAELSLSMSGPFGDALAADADNLVLRAARALCDAVGSSLGARLRLEKHLPVASGIGGGSSDAAAALKALNQIWRLELSEPQLAAVARDLGADAPVCVRARAAWMTETGETFAPMGAPPLHAVLANPLLPLPTADVYRQFDRLGVAPPLTPRRAPLWRDLGEAVAAVRAMGNHLEAPARALMPEIGDVMSSLAADKRALHVAISGSGATVFALCADRSAADALAADIAESRADWWVRAARLG
ncbi:MAG TPA: 4-(cytidine 5'-diphospho)-2-C-methyl-D-erythritol kinase [Caulobacterales bacterium]|nr:4-(cytidine 5'-diphospho)-2-C-methyl-D-erythritol kinase [Caulobacterales bacterium]